MGIELDDESHLDEGAQEYDRRQQEFIACFGIFIVRVRNAEVQNNLDGVLEMIGREIIVCRSRLMTP
jgi:very-short-patch-repair endonuclease